MGKIHLGKKWSSMEAAPYLKDKEHFPCINLESEGNLDIKPSMMNRDITAKVTVRIVRTNNEMEKGKSSQRLELEVRNIDFGNQIQDKDLQDDIADALEQVKENKKDEDAEDAKDE